MCVDMFFLIGELNYTLASLIMLISIYLLLIADFDFWFPGLTSKTSPLSKSLWSILLKAFRKRKTKKMDALYTHISQDPGGKY